MQDLAVLPPGHRLLEYEIQEVLGRGGFGITYLAIDSNLSKKVAIKEYFPREFASRDGSNTIRPSGNQDDRDTFEWGLRRFLDEARILALFEDPNIISVKRFFEANGTAYLVMDYCDGLPLDEIIKRDGPLDEQNLLQILIPLLSSLKKIHSANFLHRDVKPANIYIKKDGTPILLDFGSARQHISTHSRTVTSLATAGYAALEQYSTSTSQGPAVDIYGLAATLYRAITGEKPQDALDRVLEDKLVPLTQKCGGSFDTNLLKGIDAAMGLRPDSRPQNIEAWMRLLDLSVSENHQPISNHFSSSRFGSKNPTSSPNKNNKALFFLPLGVVVTLLLSIFLINDKNIFTSNDSAVIVTPSVITPVLKKNEPETKIEAKPVDASKNSPTLNFNNKSVVANVRTVQSGLNPEIDILPFSDIRVGDIVIAENGNTYTIFYLHGSIATITPLSLSNPQGLKNGMKVYGDKVISKPPSGRVAEGQVPPIQKRLDLVANITNIIYNYNYAEIIFTPYANVRVGDVLTDGRNFSCRIEKINGSQGSIAPIGSSNFSNLVPGDKLYSRGAQ